MSNRTSALHCQSYILQPNAKQIFTALLAYRLLKRDFFQYLQDMSSDTRFQIKFGESLCLSIVTDN